MGIWRRKHRVVAVALVAALLASVILLASDGLAVVDQEILVNGNFEGGFGVVPGCGAVGSGWGCFNNGGTVSYGYYDDQWDRVVADGKHSQLIQISTLQFAASQPDRYAGIFQTVNLTKGGSYQFRVRGLMREKNPDPNEDRFRYRVQWGYTPDGSADFTKVTNWVELPWDNIYEVTAPGQTQSFSTSFVAPSNRITLFLRLWKKWGTAYKDVEANLDAIGLFGPGAGAAAAAPVILPNTGGVPVTIPPASGNALPVIVPPPAGSTAPIVIPPATQPSAPVVIPPANQPSAPVVIPPASGNPVPVIIPPAGSGNAIVIPPAGGNPAPVGAAQAGVCTGGNYIRNGNFESGFANGVGYYWGAFNNGGATNFGYHDDTWGKVVRDGGHAQLLEINTRNMGAADANRFAGIYQVVGGLIPGQTYEFSLWGQMREEVANPGEDPYRYRVQWGYAPAGTNASWTSISNWSELPWNDIYVREVGGSLLPFSAKFAAPSGNIVIGVRAVKKWGTPNRELDVDVDAIRLASCQVAQAPQVIQPVYYPAPVGKPVVVNKPVVKAAPACVWYTVKRGDSLNRIAARYGRSVSSIMAANKISNPNRIYAGQALCIC